MVDGTRLPISNALIRVSSPGIDMRSVRETREGVWDTRTDTRGRFAVQVPYSPKISLNAYAAGYQEASGALMSGDFRLYHIAFPSGKAADIVVELRPALYVTGIVTDLAGRPLAGVEVEATMREERSTGYLSFDTTGPDGRFEIFDFPVKPRDKSERGQLVFRAPDRLTQACSNVYVLSEMARTNLHVTMDFGYAVRGVAAAAGKPLADLVVEAVPADGQAAWRTTWTDAQGKFVVRGLPDGKVTLRTHSPSFDQQGRTTIRLSGGDAVADLQVEPVVLRNPPKPVGLFGMKLADMTPELQALYDLDLPTGVVVLDPGVDPLRLGIGKLSQGDRFWIVGEKPIRNLREMVDELLWIDATAPPDRTDEKSRAMIRIVYAYRDGRGTNTQYLSLTKADVAELQKLKLSFAPP
jgi:5-hydroxyisourate hydrolase-like protein (transthyretin family)